MTRKLSRRTLLSGVFGAVSGAGATLLIRDSDYRRTGDSESESNETNESQECPKSEQNPREKPAKTHVLGEGAHRGENNFMYFLDQSSLGLDANQPDEVYCQIFVKLDNSWEQPTLADTCKLFWAGSNLSAGPAGQTGNSPTGDDGWSVRIYSRGPDQNGSVSMGSYVYHLDQDGRFGDLWEWPNEASIGMWNRINTYVKLNSVTDGSANYDGIVQTWLNGELQTDRTDLRWRTTENLGFDRLGPGSYWGGDRGSPQNNIVYYDKFQYRIGSKAPFENAC